MQEGKKENMVKSIRSAWLSVFSGFQRAERQPDVSTDVGHMDKYPTHALVVLPDGQLMYARNASLVAAKDVLAAQRAAERRMQSARGASARRCDANRE